MIQNKKKIIEDPALVGERWLTMSKSSKNVTVNNSTKNAQQFQAGISYGAGLGIMSVLSTVMCCWVQKKMMSPSSSPKKIEEEQ